MKKITLFMLFFSTFWGYSQVRDYTFTQANGTYNELIGTTTSLGNTTTNDQYFIDPGTPLGGTASTGPGFDIGFSFMFNGSTYDKFGVHANGWIALGSSAFTPSVNMAGSGTNLNAPLKSTTVISPAALAARIIPLGDDLKAQANTQGNASIQFQLGGTAPNRVMVIQWKNYMRGNGDSLNFQVVLHETTNTIDFIYGTMTAIGASTSPEVGMMADPSATAYTTNFVNRTGSWSATTAGTNVNFGVTLQKGTVPASGLTFTWTPPTCSEPENLAISAITTSGATLNWGSFLPAPSGYEYICSTSSALPTGAGTATSNAAATVSGLTPGTNYNVFIRSACSAQFTNWINLGTFKTKCLDVTAYTENFDSYTAGTSSIPTCWSSAGNDACYIAAGTAIPAPNSLYMNSSGTTVSYAILPPVSNLQLGTYRLKFKAYATNASRTLDVGYFTNINDPNSFLSIKTINLPSPAASNADIFTVVPTTIPSGVKNLVFRNSGTGGTIATALYIDDVIWELNPPCTDLKNIAVKSPTASSIVLSWDITGTETAWQYIAAPATVTDPNTLPTASIIDVALASVTVNGSTRTMTVGNLTLGTSYRIWVRSKCGGTAFGLWSGSPVFATPCALTATIAQDFDGSTTLPSCWNMLGSTGTVSIAPLMGDASSNALKLVTQGPGADNGVWVGLPPVSTSASGYRLRFKYQGDATTITLQIVSLQDPANIVVGPPANFTVLATPTFAAQGTQYAFSSSTLSGSSPYLALRIYSNSLFQRTVYIDDLVWEPVPTCPDVSVVTEAGITGESVDLAWTSSGVESNWQYALGTSTTTNPNTVTAVDFSSPFINGTSISSSIYNLTPSTPYKIWIRSKCNGASLGSWIGPIYFTTNCPGVETFTQNFDSSTNFPSCWTKVGAGNAAVVAQAGTSSPNILKIDGNATTQGIVAMQPVSNFADGTNKLRFRLSGSVVGATVEVGYTTNVSDPTKFISLNHFFTVASTTAFSSESIELGYEPASQVLAFRNPGTTAGSVYIDDVVWELLPPCTDISNVAISGITSTTASLSWNKGGSEGSWEYAMTGTTESDPTKLTAVTFTNPVIADPNVSSVINGLTPATTYKVWIRSKCSSTMTGNWIGPYTFLTTCAPTSTKITEQFDLTTNLPACWTKVGTTGTVSVTPTLGASTPNALTLVSNATANAVVALPPVTNAADGTYRLRFKFKSSVANTNINIGYVTNITDPSSFVLVQAFAATASNVFYSEVVNLGGNPTSQLLAFRNPNASTIMIDDVNWEPIPSCADVSQAVATNITSNSVSLGWTAGGSETAWQYALGASTDQNSDLLTAADFVAPAVSDSNIVGTINNLTPSTSYNVWVRSKCSGSVGVWIGPYPFITTCSPTSATITEHFDANTNLPACWTQVGTSGTVAVVQSAITGATSPNALQLVSTANNMAVVTLPPVTNAGAGTNILRFKFRSSAPHTTIEMGYVTNITDPTTFNALQSFDAAAPDVYFSRSILPGTGPTSPLLAFRNPNTCTIYIDDVSWVPMPSCPDLFTVTPVKSSSTSVDLNWAVAGSETAWQYALTSTTETDPTKLTPIDFVTPTVTGSNVTATINNLTPSTSYKVWIRTKCSATSFGIWSDKASFATNCSPVTEFTQNFDASTAFSSCWANVGGGNVNIIGYSANSAPNALSLTYSSASTQPVIAMTPVSNGGAGTHRLRFSLKVGIINGSVEVGYLKVLSDPNSFVSLQSFTKADTGVFENMIAQWNNNNLVTEVLAFRTASPSVIIDDVVWEPVPGCADISALAAKSINDNTAALTWTAGGTETKWQYALGAATDTDPTALNGVDVSGPSTGITLNNLSPVTTYKVWVRSKCDNGAFGIWVGPSSFTTPCAPVSNFTENFDSTTLGYLPSCWTKVGNQGNVYAFGQTANIVAPTAPEFLYLYNSIAGSAIAAMPPLTNLLDGTLTLTFKFAGATTSAGLDVGYLKDITDPTSFVNITTVKTTAANTFQPQTVKIPTLPTGAQVLAFRNSAVSVAAYVDDISVSSAASALGVGSFNDVNFSYYPNPVRDVLNLSLNQEITNVVVCNLLGQQVINQSANGNQVKIDMSGLSRGAYLVKVTAENQSKTIKVVKE